MTQLNVMMFAGMNTCEPLLLAGLRPGIRHRSLTRRPGRCMTFIVIAAVIIASSAAPRGVTAIITTGPWGQGIPTPGARELRTSVPGPEADGSAQRCIRTAWFCVGVRRFEPTAVSRCTRQPIPRA